MAIDFQFDYSHMMAANIGAEHGLQESDLAALQPLLDRAHREIHRDLAAPPDRHELGFWDLPDTMAPLLPRIREVADELTAAADAHLTLGIGGSYLGARMLQQALCHTYYNELPADRRGGRPRIYFEGNGVDQDSFAELLDRLGDEPVTCHVVSKSGGTLETAAAYRLVRDDLGDRLVGTALTTGPGSKLERFCRQGGLADRFIFALPDNVGGRYSVLTTVGLIPAAMMGLDLDALLEGAATMRAMCSEPDLTRNPAYLYATLQYLSLLAGRDISVMAVWTKALESFGFWYDQLSAESLGKVGRGRTPITAVCTRELHSRGQQHQEGAHDKVITNLLVAQPRHGGLSLTATADDQELAALAATGQKPEGDLRHRTDGIFYACGRDLDAINKTAYRATDMAYAKAQRPGMTMTIGQLDAAHIGALIFLFELATVTEGKLMAVNPLNQPGVQAYKDFLTGLLGKPGAEEFREEYDSLRASTVDYTLGG